MRIAGLVIALMVLAAAPARAEDYPTRPIRILVPYAPGGIADIAARLVGGKLTDAFGQQVIIENRPGGNGFIAVADAAKSTPDGYTLVMVTTGDVAINPALFKDMPYRWDDFTPISAVSDAPMVWATNASMPYQSIADVLAAAKAQPGRLSVATPGNGSVNQIVMEWMALNTGTQFQHIPYKGGAPAAAALAGGDIPFGVLASSSVAPQVKAGRLRVLAVTGAQPSKLNPEWPTLQSQGVKEVDASNWTLLLAPKGTPKEIVDRMNAVTRETLKDDNTRKRLSDLAANLPSEAEQTPAWLGDFVGKEIDKWVPVIKKAGVTVE
jgi:tripartite-type tricarboxylate transporter receptor subunit TctC